MDTHPSLRFLIAFLSFMISFSTIEIDMNICRYVYTLVHTSQMTKILCFCYHTYVILWIIPICIDAYCLRFCLLFIYCLCILIRFKVFISVYMYIY